MEAITEIAVVTIPAYSHQASILEFCKRLVLLQNDGHFHVTCFIPTLRSPPSASMALVQSLASSITCTFLPPVNLHDQPQDLPMEVQLQLAVSRSMPLVRDALKSLAASSRLAAMVAEPISIEALEVAKELNMKSYLYFPCSAMMLSLCLFSEKLNQKMVSCGDIQFRDLAVPIEIPGCVPISGKDLPDSHQDRSSLSYEHFLQRCQLYHLAEGILLNSFEELEAGAIRAWQHEEPAGNGESRRRYPSVHAIGPIINKIGSRIEPNQSEPEWDTCLRWLDKQPPNSVLFVSFGSGGRLSQAQINELALGLELSNQRFLWVNVKSPSDRASASYLRDNKNEEEEEEEDDPLHLLPSGFLERTKDRGLVMATWAPQVEVLGHSSTGGFLSHCGWNSILESIVEGVPIIAWPLFAEQRTNATMLGDGLKVAMRPGLSENNNSEIVEKEEISRVIKCIMEGGEEEEGEEIRRRMKKLKDAAACALMEDGSSTKTLSNLALQWRNICESRSNVDNVY